MRYSLMEETNSNILIRRASAAWRKHSDSKQEVVAALDKMHRRRAVAAAVAS
jgi:adenylate kinase